ncbi:MAG: hypothetical protein KDA88_16100 [Planctomycetaceae bacterium]|nr:hypothetical protein [Planctomycetaceae bacterium]MCB9949878.1 hypothetical protein [Planctomycetaceae bacterium]
MSSPFDLQKQTPPLIISAAFIPVMAPLDAGQLTDSMLSTEKQRAKVLEEKTVIVGGRLATRLLVEKESGDKTVHHLRLFSPNGEKLFVFQINAQPETLESFMPEVEAIIESIKFE